MCVLASAVDIDLLTHREAVTGYPAGHRLARFYPLGQYDGFTRDTLHAYIPREVGESLLDIQLLREGRFGGELIFITFAPKILKKRSIR